MKSALPFCFDPKELITVPDPICTPTPEETREGAYLDYYVSAIFCQLLILVKPEGCRVNSYYYVTFSIMPRALLEVRTHGGEITKTDNLFPSKSIYEAKRGVLF